MYAVFVGGQIKNGPILGAVAFHAVLKPFLGVVSRDGGGSWVKRSPFLSLCRTTQDPGKTEWPHPWGRCSLQMFYPSLGVSPATVMLGVQSVEIHSSLLVSKYTAGRVPTMAK